MTAAAHAVANLTRPRHLVGRGERRNAQQQTDAKSTTASGDNKKELSNGKLTLIDNSIDQTTGTIHMKATFANVDERLWPGEFVNLRLILSTRKGVATVPQQTVQVGPNGYYAYVIKADNTVERRVVEIASMQDGIAVVTKGLNIGEKIVVDGQYRLTEGAKVNLRQPDNANAMAEKP